MDPPLDTGQPWERPYGPPHRAISRPRLIAFGVGLLVSSLIPASAKEGEAAQTLKIAAEPVTTQLADAAKDIAQGLQEPAQEAMKNVKTTAAHGLENVKEEGQSAVADVKDTTADAKDHVQQAREISGIRLRRTCSRAIQRTPVTRRKGAHVWPTPTDGEPLPWPTYRILSVAARLDELRINRRLSHLGLTKGALNAPESVADLEPAKVSDVAALMWVSKQSFGKVLRRLENLGLVSKERGSDNRNTSIRLTVRGRRVLACAEDLLGTLAQPGTSDETALRRSLQQHLNDLRKNWATQTSRQDGPALHPH